jgi:hypothetical protein
MSRGLLFAFLIGFAITFLRFRLPPYPMTTAKSARVALVVALIASFVQSTSRDPNKDSQQKK